MATKEEITKGLAKLEANYGLPPHLVDDKTATEFVRLWEDRFSKVEAEIFAQAVEVAINKRFRFPNIADMFQILTEIGYRPLMGARLIRPIAVYRDMKTGYTCVRGGDKQRPKTIPGPDGTTLVKVFEEEDSGDSEKKDGENHGGGSAAKSE